MNKPKVGIIGLTGCSGDQLVILNCEDQLLDLVGAIDIRDFLTATSANDTESRLDVAFVEGSVVSQKDEDLLRRVRERCTILVALGTCAVWGGIPTMDRDQDRPALLRAVYGDLNWEYDTCPAKALHEVVKVDLNLPGCPIEKDQFLATVANLLNGNLPLLPDYAVCTECKMKENNCLLIEKKQVCLGPVSVAGCQARCPSLNIPCVGCRGPCTDANLKSAAATYAENGVAMEDVIRKMKTFAPVPVSEQP
ncbi:MAG: NADH:ubiquinone oxidoreductase [Candidatus Zixiibacteriota bacterium]|nr:MAG: NADH:ubiquinone oxidoreductase [candidate division Zixibacteria bacterium]